MLVFHGKNTVFVQYCQRAFTHLKRLIFCQKNKMQSPIMLSHLYKLVNTNVRRTYEGNWKIRFVTTIIQPTTHAHLFLNYHFIKVLGDPEVTANLFCNFVYLYWEGLHDLQYIFALIYGTPDM